MPQPATRSFCVADRNAAPRASLSSGRIYGSQSCASSGLHNAMRDFPWIWIMGSSPLGGDASSAIRNPRCLSPSSRRSFSL
ncbi:hypothetical protein TNCV_541671 [Trichonephila clavipes]|nr:hypothetical protein TNCV_541671 [Trichonephila clavipes]